MKFLLDNNLSPRLVPLLAALGHSVENVRDHGMQAASLLQTNLQQVADDLNAGSVVVVTDTDLRVRRLPIPPGRG